VISLHLVIETARFPIIHHRELPMMYHEYEVTLPMGSGEREEPEVLVRLVTDIPIVRIPSP